MPRAYGEMPRSVGNYERVAPSDASDSWLKLIGGQKLFGSTMKVSEKFSAEQRAKIRGPGSMPQIVEKQGGSGSTAAATGGLQSTPKTAVSSVGGTVSTVTQRKQAQASAQHQINMAEISSVSQHKPLLKQ